MGQALEPRDNPQIRHIGILAFHEYGPEVFHSRRRREAAIAPRHVVLELNLGTGQLVHQHEAAVGRRDDRRALWVEDAGPEAQFRFCNPGCAIGSGHSPTNDQGGSDQHYDDSRQHTTGENALASTFDRYKIDGSRCRRDWQLPKVKFRDVASFWYRQNDRLIHSFRGKVFLEAKPKETRLRTHNAVFANVVALRPPEDNCADALFVDRSAATLPLLLADETKETGEAVRLAEHFGGEDPVQEKPLLLKRRRLRSGLGREGQCRLQLACAVCLSR